MVVLKKKAKKAKKQETKALAIPAQSNIETVGDALTHTMLALSVLAQNFSGKREIQNSIVGESYGALKQIEKVIDDTMKVAKQHMTTLIKVHGQKTTDAGSMKATFGDYVYEMRPTRTGLDAKKVEALLRQKGVDVNKYMEPKVTYVIDNAKMLAAAADGILSTTELKNCEYDESYSVQPPKKVGEG